MIGARARPGLTPGGWFEEAVRGDEGPVRDGCDTSATRVRHGRQLVQAGYAPHAHLFTAHLVLAIVTRVWADLVARPVDGFPSGR